MYGLTSLRLIPGEAPAAFDPPGWNGPPPSARPGDRCEPVHKLDLALQEKVRREAVEAGIDPPLALILCVEQALVLRDLGTDDELIARFDAAAAISRVRAELSRATSAYLSALRPTSDNAARSRGASGAWRLPVRLGDRVAPADLAWLVETGSLNAAIAWERAAVLEGRTMGEWATLVALRALTG